MMTCILHIPSPVVYLPAHFLREARSASIKVMVSCSCII
jgi:hypothetical protein